MKTIKRYLFQILSFLFIFIIVMYGLRSTAQSAKVNEKASLEQALQRGIVECYALEGRYPENVNYLVNEYHIVYNDDHFDIDYQIIASNIMPTVTVIEK